MSQIMRYNLQIRPNSTTMSRSYIEYLSTINPTGIVIELHIQRGIRNQIIQMFQDDINLFLHVPQRFECFLSTVLSAYGVPIDFRTGRILSQNGVRFFNRRRVYSLSELASSVLGVVWGSLNSRDLVNWHLGWTSFQLDLFIFPETEPRDVGILLLNESFVLEAFDGPTETTIKLEEEKLEVGIDEDCCICLGSCGVGDVVSSLPCAHVFHSNCIAKWISKNPTCPLCRASVLS